MSRSPQSAAPGAGPRPDRSITLSIVIPTYNRSRLLGHLLQSIASDFAQWPADLEVIVLDNASPDDTTLCLSQFRDRGMPLTVHRHASNIGMDANLAACFGSASGRYFWQIGDDEMLYKGCAAWVLAFCREHDFGLLHLANGAIEPGGQNSIASLAIDRPVRVEPIDSESMIRNANAFLTFISSNVVHRECILEANPGFDPLAETGTWLPQLAWIYDVLKVHNVHYWVRTPMFAALADNTGGYRLIEVFCVNLDRITRKRLADAFPAAPRILANAVLLRVLPGQFNRRAQKASANGFVPENIIAELDRLRGHNAYYRWLVRWIIVGNGSISRIAFLATRIFNKIDKMSGNRFL